MVPGIVFGCFAAENISKIYKQISWISMTIFPKKIYKISIEFFKNCQKWCFYYGNVYIFEKWKFCIGKMVGCFLALFLNDFWWLVSFWKTGLGAFLAFFLICFGWSAGYDGVLGAPRCSKTCFEICFVYCNSFSSNNSKWKTATWYWYSELI